MEGGGGEGEGKRKERGTYKGVGRGEGGVGGIKVVTWEGRCVGGVVSV